MKTIQITILAEDIRTTKYCNFEECAITKALHRAGIKKYEFGGEIGRHILGKTIKTPNDLSDKVVSMYGYGNNPIEPQDFRYDLEIPDDWEITK